MTTELPPALPTETARLWIALHPEVDPVLFWGDQSKKHRRAGRRWLIISIFFSIAFVLQVVGLVLDIIAGAQ